MMGAKTAYQPAARVSPGRRYWVRTVRTPRRKPIVRLPLSPMKMEAGAKLKQRKPASAPTSAARTAATNHWGLGMVRVVARKAAEEIAATPAERPSMLSRKL